VTVQGVRHPSLQGHAQRAQQCDGNAVHELLPLALDGYSMTTTVGVRHWHPTVLVIDDDEVVTETFARMLQLEGYHVRTASTAELGLHEAEQCSPDVILLDLRMPLVDGLGFLRCLRAREEQREIPVAIVTGDYFLDDSVSEEILRLGAELRFKPLWLEDLVALTRSLLAERSQFSSPPVVFH
jgi:DNA-binding response OmpR family regulator